MSSVKSIFNRCSLHKVTNAVQLNYKNEMVVVVVVGKVGNRNILETIQRTVKHQIAKRSGCGTGTHRPTAHESLLIKCTIKSTFTLCLFYYQNENSE